jgi:hypothetical protein
MAFISYDLGQSGGQHDEARTRNDPAGVKSTFLFYPLHDILFEGKT